MLGLELGSYFTISHFLNIKKIPKPLWLILSLVRCFFLESVWQITEVFIFLCRWILSVFDTSKYFRNFELLRILFITVYTVEWNNIGLPHTSFCRRKSDENVCVKEGKKKFIKTFTRTDIIKIFQEDSGCKWEAFLEKHVLLLNLED